MSKCPLFKQLNPWKLSHHVVRNVEYWLPTDAASYARKNSSSATPLRHRAVQGRIWTEWLNGDTLSRKSIPGMESEIMFPKDRKSISQGTSSLLPCAVNILLPYLQQEAFHYFWSALYWVVRLKWLVPTETELTGFYWDWTNWFLLRLKWLVPTETTDWFYWDWTDWFLLRLNWLVST